MDEDKNQEQERKSVLDLPPRVVKGGKALEEGAKPYMRTNGQILTRNGAKKKVKCLHLDVQQKSCQIIPPYQILIFC